MWSESETMAYSKRAVQPICAVEKWEIVQSKNTVEDIIDTK